MSLFKLICKKTIFFYNAYHKYSILFQESKNTLAIVCIVVMMTYIIGFAVGLGEYIEP